ncbi:glycoside hydrolase family 13 protein [Rugamonas apoptosis]|uniref:Glycoside hydrolase family 13 protein n=1 Tax=Rugamonas apoptosis TaxID=2758570 RepID=A0A7W2IJJ9_9BURK|nr:glycoside hydrolase family 13 protein [Rugamonas apoptosis]MBA5686599.1 glycoside hydrolase family 13 protein [Rugamonas apoptosis]
MRRLIMLAALAALPPSLTWAQPADHGIDHLEPPSWWTGMRSPQLELMVHGPRIAELEPALHYPGVRIAQVTRTSNDNYMFIQLNITPGTLPGKLTLQFRQHGKTVLSHPYTLQARAAGSAERIGFGGADAIYEVMPDRYANGDPANDNTPGMTERANRQDGSGRHGGDLAGMAAHLDYVAAMGYTMLWPTPLLEANMQQGSYHGYASTNHYRIDPRYGSNEQYRDFVAQARTRGIGVIQDVVLNHIGDRHWWMRDLPSEDWITHQGKFVPTQHHRVAVQDPYGSQADRRDFTQGWFVDTMPDLNQANPHLATYLMQNSIWWIEYAGLAGLRVDTYSYSDSAFLSAWSARIMGEYPKLNLVGEEWSPHIPIVARWQEGKRNFDGYASHMPGMMDFPLNDTLRRALASDDADGAQYSLTSLYETLSQDYLYADPGKMVLFEGNHDLPRIYSDLHEDDALFRMAMAYVLTAPRIPQFYAGTEVLMTSTTGRRDDASYRRDFPGGWAGDTVNAFTGAGLTPRQLAAQAFLKKLLNWRKGQPVIHHGKTMQFGPEQNTYVFFRYDGARKVMVAFNKNHSDTTLATARFQEMLAGVHGGDDVISGQHYALGDTLTLPARSVLVLALR